MNHSFVNSPAVLIFPAGLGPVFWAYSVWTLVTALGLIIIFLRGDWQRAQGLEKLVLLGPVFYVAPVAAFGTEHFTFLKDVASSIPAWIPWHEFWTILLGVCFIAAGLSIVTKIQARLSATLLGLTFFLFVLLMDSPAWIQNPRERVALVLMLRELTFSAGALALASSLSSERHDGVAPILATIARYFIAITVLVYSLEQFLHGDHVPAVPLARLTPDYIFGHAVWTYLCAVAFALTGMLLLIGKKTRAAATWLGLTVLLVELVVYVPMAVVDRATIVGFNFMADTLMFCGAVLLLAGAMPRET